MQHLGNVHLKDNLPEVDQSLPALRKVGNQQGRIQYTTCKMLVPGIPPYPSQSDITMKATFSSMVKSRHLFQGTGVSNINFNLQ